MSKGEEITKKNPYGGSGLIEAIDTAIAEAVRERDAEIVKLRKQIRWVIQQIEGDFMLEGKWVDNPSFLIRVLHEDCKNTLEKHQKRSGGG